MTDPDMPISLCYLGWTIVLAIVQIIIASAAKRAQDGMKWASGNRDEQPPVYKGLAGRMVRAQANLYETLPLFIGAVLLVFVSGHDKEITHIGSGLYFWARVAYIPAYAVGLVPWRSIIWGVSVIGLLMVLASFI